MTLVAAPAGVRFAPCADQPGSTRDSVAGSPRYATRWFMLATTLAAGLALILIRPPALTSASGSPAAGTRPAVVDAAR
jgi:hypothetical protein